MSELGALFGARVRTDRWEASITDARFGLFDRLDLHASACFAYDSTQAHMRKNDGRGPGVLYDLSPGPERGRESSRAPKRSSDEHGSEPYLPVSYIPGQHCQLSDLTITAVFPSPAY